MTHTEIPYRGEHGRILKGGHQPQEVRDKISRSQRERHRRAREQLGPPPDRKRCTQCKEWKRVDIEDRSQSEFQIRSRKLTTGEIRYYPSGECKECNAARAAAWRESKRQEGALSDLQREWNSRRDPEHRKAYQREYQAFLRREQGMEMRGPWKRYRKFALKLDPKLPIEPFQNWIRERAAFYVKREDLPPVRPGDVAGLGFLANLCGISDRTLRRYLDGYEIDKKGRRRELTHVPLGTVDQCLTREGSTFIFELYEADPGLQNVA